MDMRSDQPESLAEPKSGLDVGIGPLTASDRETPIEAQIQAVGEELLQSLRGLLDALPGPGAGPQALARTLGIDKVLASRILKATRGHDAMTAISHMPGPDPLRRVVKAAARRGLPAPLTDRALAAVEGFEVLIRDRIGDRSLLDSILTAWVPEARREFELRRKQAAFKAISQLKGVQADSTMATVMLSPSSSGTHIDVVWLNGLFAAHRVRPGVGVKITTRRVSGNDADRRPLSLDGTPVEDLEGLLLRPFCSEPMPRLNVQRHGAAVHYLLADEGFGPGASVDVVFGEANINEIARFVPPGSDRKSYFFAEVMTPSKLLQFDVLVHEDLYRAEPPGLRIYDASFEGVASPNDPSRDLDRMDMLEMIEELGMGAHRFRSTDVPRYAELIRHAFGKMRWDGSRFRGYRCRVDYPVYGSQVMMTFRAAEAGK